MLKVYVAVLILLLTTISCGKVRQPGKEGARGGVEASTPNSGSPTRDTGGVRQPSALAAGLPEMPRLSANNRYIMDRIKEDLEETRAEFDRGEDIHFSCVGLLTYAQDKDFLQETRPDAVALREEVIRLCTLDWRLIGCRDAAERIRGVLKIDPEAKYMMDCVDLDKHLKVLQENNHSDLPEVVELEALYRETCR